MVERDIVEYLKYGKDGDNLYYLNEIDAYIIIENEYRGVGLKLDNDSKILGYVASFENVEVIVKEKQINAERFYVLELIANEKVNYDRFAIICSDFLERKNREEIILNPNNWVNTWKELLGNKLTNGNAYSLIGELVALKILLMKDKTAILTNHGSYDIETECNNYEIKTTIMRYNAEIEVHSQFQLETNNGKPLKLIFIRLEETEFGESIQSDLEEIEKNSEVNAKLIKSKIETLDSEEKNKRYKVLEIREFCIDEKFPKITAESFKTNKIPNNIKSIKYTIDLNGINDYNKLEY